MTGARYAELFAFLRRLDGATDPALADLEERVLRRYERDRVTYSDILEPSFSWARGAPSMYRFSYAFPDFRADPGGVAAALFDLCAPFGEVALAQARRLLRAARHPAAEQPLFGIALDGPGRRRIKLYLQFRDGAGVASIKLAERMLGCGLLDRLPPGGALHLLGVDLGEGGVTGAKLYLHHRRIDLTEASPIGPVALFERLRAAGRREVRDVLAIHRLVAPEDAGLERAAEIDLSLSDNGLSWAEVRPLLPAAGELSGWAFAALEAAFPLRVRRISTPVGRDDKLNVYYVLT
jgi:hypothetical protein